MPEILSEQDQSIESSENKQEWYQDRFFWIGFLGWFLVNGLSWSVGYGLLGLLCIPINIIVMIYFAFKQRMVGLGLVSAFGVNFVLTLFMGGFFQAICFAPFFINW